MYAAQVNTSYKMEPMESGSSTLTDHSSKNYMKIVSEPAFRRDQPDDVVELKNQISAPSYFHSLSENEAPPFKKPDVEDEPHILIDMVVTEEDAIRMIAVSHTKNDSTFRKYLADYLEDKGVVLNHYISEKSFLVSLLLQLIDYSAQRDFSGRKLACMLAIYLKTHLCFKRYFWTSPTAVWEYFKETLIRHTVEDSPDGCEVFEPDESYDILTHFHILYLRNIPLIHVMCFGAYRLKFTWPF